MLVVEVLAAYCPNRAHQMAWRLHLHHMALHEASLFGLASKSAQRVHRSCAVLVLLVELLPAGPAVQLVDGDLVCGQSSLGPTVGRL